MGFTQKNARRFFELINSNNINLLLDIRLNNKSQLAGFTKGDDLKFFLETICNCDYSHCVEFAPTKNILDDYKSKKITWSDYDNKYTELMELRGDYKSFTAKYANYKNICLLCSEPTPEQCHRRLLAALIENSNPLINITHI
jgi:uncharacterized protein (DUF488 family)